MDCNLNKIIDFTESLHNIYQSDFSEEMEDYQNVWSDMMLQENVVFKAPSELSPENSTRCYEKFNGDVEEMFYSEVNTQAHYKCFALFNDVCREFMDFSKSRLGEKRISLLDLGAAFQEIHVRYGIPSDNLKTACYE